ncbi:hypothetical protein M407DRAFT_247160 [Tulasnella calospora MUT 4182]|uniref:Uncharacterized protein n=1 Tax=Tulasnella calospora MUT 4182 TaxID=1051891 RepID=A0A0C3L224_9AGAM|nr:hypothetical protein M407DRAFT_247160 [Tulasnella calospora MUT 4182]
MRARGLAVLDQVEERFQGSPTRRPAYVFEPHHTGDVLDGFRVHGYPCGVLSANGPPGIVKVRGQPPRYSAAPLRCSKEPHNPDPSRVPSPLRRTIGTPIFTSDDGQYSSANASRSWLAQEGPVSSDRSLLLGSGPDRDLEQVCELVRKLPMLKLSSSSSS